MTSPRCSARPNGPIIGLGRSLDLLLRVRVGAQVMYVIHRGLAFWSGKVMSEGAVWGCGETSAGTMGRGGKENFEKCEEKFEK